MLPVPLGAWLTLKYTGCEKACMSATNEFNRVKNYIVSSILDTVDFYYDNDIEYYVNEKWLDKEIATLLKSCKVMDATRVKQHKELKRLYDYPQQLYFEIKQELRQSYEATKKWRSEHGMKGHRTRTPAKKSCPVKVNFRGMI